MPDSLQPVDNVLGARYRYYTVNIVTNTVIGEIPFEDVSYERSVKSPGSFDGKITITEQTNNLDLYNATLPGKTALYVVRNDEAVWGGIIWGRTYDLKGRSLAISASEFTSYLSHRIIWKTYSHDCSAKLTKATSSSYVLVTIQNKVLKAAPAVTDSSGNPNYVTVTFSDNALRKYSGKFKIVGTSSSPKALANPGRTAFYIDMPALPKKSTGVYDGVGITLKADTYEFLRDIITSTFSDFTDIEFPNTIVEPGIKVPYELSTKQLTITDDSNGVATITTTSEHDLTVGQRIELVNVDPMLDGFQTISAIPTKTSFQFTLTNPVSRHDKVSRVYLDSSLSSAVALTTNIDMVKARQVVEYLPQYVKYVQRVSGEITVTFNSVHTFKRGDKVIVNFEKNKVTQKTEEVKTKNTDGTTTTKKEVVNTFDFQKYNDTVTVTSATATTITFLDPDPDHVSPGYDTAGSVTPAKNSVKNATPVPLLLLYPQNSSGYNMGDDIRVDGVDEPGWQYPVYDGYHTVYEVNPGTAYTITKYKAESDWLTEDTDDVDDKGSIAYVFCTTDPGIEAGDEFVVAGITGTTAMNGTYEALIDSFYDPATSLYAVAYRKQIAAFSIVTQASGASLTKNGSTWIAYQPGTSELRYSLKNEPDADSGIELFTYDAAKGSKANVVQIKTKSRHGLKVGDTVKIVYGQSDKNVDQETYGGTVKVTAVQDYDIFSYTLVAGKHKKAAPKKDVELTIKSGTVTRIKHGTLTPTVVEEEIDAIRTEVTASGATQVTIYAPGHNFKKGDYVSVNVNNSSYKGVNTGSAPKKVTYASGNYFRYTAGAPVIEGDTSTISQVIYNAAGSTIKFKTTKFGTYTARTATATVLEPNKTTGYVTFTTSSAHNMVVGQKATISGFVAPTTSTSSTATTNHTISSITYDANTKNAIVRFSAAHSLDVLNDVGASFVVAGANKTATAPSGTNLFPSVDLSWLNATHEIVAIPDTTSIAIKYLGQTKNWVVYSGATGVGSPTTVQTITVTQTKYDPQDLTIFNMTAEIAAVPTSTKVSFKYPDSSDSALASSISLTGLGISISAAAQKGSGAQLLEAGDFVYITGLTDSGTNYYSRINGDGYKVKSVASIDATYAYVTIANPVKSDGKYIKYADKSSGITTAKMYRGYEVGGSAYLSTSALESGDSKNSYIITNVSRPNNSNVATVTVGTHELAVGDYVNLEVYADNYDAFSQNGRDCTITSVTDTTFTYTMRANNNIEHISWRDGKATLYFKNSTAGAHNYTVGDVITIASLPSPYTGFNRSGRSVVATGPFSITYALTAAEASRSSKLAKTPVTAGTVTRTTTQAVDKATYGVVTRVPSIYKKPIAYARTYGEFPNNASIGGLTFSTNDYSTQNQSTSPVYGSELKTVAEILDQYSNSITGFDYRIDVSLATDQNGNKSFSRQFVLIPIYPESLTNYLATLPGGKLAKGQVARPSAFGADRLVFEYPGNISNVSMAEKAENSATRIFVTGSNNKAGAGAETPYAAAAATDLLADNWPLLDKKETVTWPAMGGNSDSSTSKTSNTYTDEWGNHDDETDYHASAVRFLSETKPPAGDFVISVNGSLTPVVGSYNPGDWCSIIINDNFVKTRLNSVLEPRKDVIVRKIDAIKVDVPNNPAFPENINLTLVTDWQVDSVGK